MCPLWMVLGVVGAVRVVHALGVVEPGPRAVLKCCRTKQALVRDVAARWSGPRCLPVAELPLAAHNLTADYTAFDIYANHIEQKQEKTTKTLQNFSLQFNVNYSPDNKKLYFWDPSNTRIYLIEDGTMKTEDPHRYKRWTTYDKLQFCVDILFIKQRSGRYVKRHRFGTILPEPDVGKTEFNFAVTGYCVTCVFIGLVLAAHAALPALRNIAGMMRMAYVATLMALYLVKATQLIHDKYKSLTPHDCIIISTMIYYLFLSSFFWLNVMSFDIWWTFRGSRKRRAIHRRGEAVKFLWYALYAWGAPLLLTLTALLIDLQPLKDRPHIVKIHFNDCLNSKNEVLLYMYMPLIVMTVINCVLFLMTVYNIWLVRRIARQFSSQESQTTQKNQNMLSTYLKLSLLMGVSWVMDIVQYVCDIAPWTFFVFNFYNLFIGLPIFFIFLFNKKTIVMLCKRFAIGSRYVARMTSTSHGRPTASDSVKSRANHTDTADTAESQLELDQKEALMVDNNK